MSRKFNIKKILKQYDDPNIGLTSLTKFARNINEDKTVDGKLKPYTQKDLNTLRRILSNNMTFNISEHARISIKRVERSFIAKSPIEMIHIDLMDITNHNLASKYIFVAVDVYTRYLFAYPMNDKSIASVKECMNKMYDYIVSCGYYPLDSKDYSLLYTDNGREFSNIERLLNDDNPWRMNLVHYISKSKHKASIAEAYIKKLRQMITNYKNTKNKVRNFITQLESFVKNINNTRSTRKIEKDYKYNDPLYHVGTIVRVENTFDRDKVFSKKSSKNYFTKELFRVSKIIPSQGQNMYELETYDGKYYMNKYVYEYELSRVGSYGLNKYIEEHGEIKQTYSPEFINHYQLMKNA